MTTPQASKATRALKGLYVATVVIVLSLASAGQIITQRSLQKQSDDSRVINIAGRQRMLSQKISKAALALKISDGVAYQQRLQELREAVDLWSRSHIGLIEGDAELGLPGTNSAQVTKMFADIEPHHQAMVKAAREVSATESSDVEQILPSLNDILANEADFLEGMNAIVFQYDDEANAKIEQLQRTQQLILITTILVLLPLFIPIQAITRKVNSLIQQMQQSGIQVTSSSTQIAASGKQLETMMTEQMTATQEVTAATHEIAKTAAHLVTVMDEVSDLAQRTTQSANTGRQGLIQVEDTMKQLSDATQSVSSKLEIISDRANSINTVVATISKVANQTNLLSVNAALEAERAGKTGTGFAAVAREVQRLADQTATAALEIKDTIEEMQFAVSNGVAEMDKFKQQVHQGGNNIRQISNQVVDVMGQIQSLTPQFSTVSQSIENQSLSAQQIDEAMEHLSNTSRQTTQSLRDTNRVLAQLQEAAHELQMPTEDRAVSRLKASGATS